MVEIFGSFLGSRWKISALLMLTNTDSNLVIASIRWLFTYLFSSRSSLALVKVKQ